MFAAWASDTNDKSVIRDNAPEDGSSMYLLKATRDEGRVVGFEV